MEFSRRNAHIILFLIPSIILINSLWLSNAMGPFWRYADPCYLYLFNALHFLKGIPATHIDHPGTPLQLLILFLIKALNPGSSVSVVEDKVLLNPEHYLQITHLVLLLGIFLTSILLSLYIYKKTKDIIAVLLTQLPGLVFLTMKSFESTISVPPVVACVDPEPLLIIILNLFNLSWFILYLAKTPKEKLKATLLLGFIGGLGLATKFTFFPILFCSLIILSWRLKLLFSAVCLLSFLLWTFPIIPLYPDLWAWVKGIATHTGVDGANKQVIVGWASLINDISRNILPGYWFFLICSISSFIWSSLKIILKQKEPVYKFVWVVNLGILIQFTMVAQHYSAHYLLPGIGLFSSAFLLIYLGLKEHPWLKYLSVALIIAMTLLCTSKALIYRAQLASFTKSISHTKEVIDAQYPGSALIASAASNPFYSQNFALLFADRFYSGMLFNKSYTHQESDKLSTFYPNSYYFNFDGTAVSRDNPGYGICDFKKRVYADDLLATFPYVLFVNYNVDFNFNNGFDLTDHPYRAHLVEQSKYSDVYILTGSTDKESSELLAASLALSQKGRYGEAFACALKSRELNYQPHGQVEFILSIIYNHLNQH